MSIEQKLKEKFEMKTKWKTYRNALSISADKQQEIEAILKSQPEIYKLAVAQKQMRKGTDEGITYAAKLLEKVLEPGTVAQPKYVAGIDQKLGRKKIHELAIGKVYKLAEITLKKKGLMPDTIHKVMYIVQTADKAKAAYK